MKPLFCSNINIDNISLTENANMFPKTLNHLFINVSRFDTKETDENNMCVFKDYHVLNIQDKKEDEVDSLLINRNGYNDVCSWKVFIDQYDRNTNVLNCRLFKIFKVMVNYHLRKRILGNVSKFKKVIIKSSMNLFKHFSFLNKHKEYVDDFSIFNDFIVIPVICFWISFKYNTCDIKMSKYLLQNFSGIRADYLVTKEIEFLTCINFDIGKSMV